MEKIQRAIIIAAGEGNRLRPITLTRPKPLVEINGVRILDTAIEALKKNGIHEIIIVCGYKKEQFYEVYKNDPDIILIENPHYSEGNNVTSLYAARDYLPESFVIEGDLIIYNSDIFYPQFEQSGYFACFMDYSPEWTLEMTDGIISNYSISGGDNCYRLWGVSMWTRRDGEILSELVRKQVEEVKDWSIYWDEIALDHSGQEFGLGVREINVKDIIEIDTVDELIEIDSSYSKFKVEGIV